MERLAASYLLKLKNDSFCSYEGACWRQLVVVNLMPWMMKNRIFSDVRLQDAVDAYNERRMILQREKEDRERGVLPRVKEGFEEVIDGLVRKKAVNEADEVLA